jgi:hypothetical protein
MKLIKYITSIGLFMLFSTAVLANEQTIKELDATWSHLANTVANGDFEGYSASYHGGAILVSGFSNESYPIATALAQWKQGFVDTKAGKLRAHVDFRFSKRLNDETTAHETGMFYYYTIDAKGKRSDSFVHMNALLVKQSGQWLIMMEFQKSQATQDEWDMLKKG